MMWDSGDWRNPRQTVLAACEAADDPSLTLRVGKLVGDKSPGEDRGHVGRQCDGMEC